MQKKIILPLILVASIAGVAFASLVVNRFPDTTGFARIPMGDGTIGSLLGKILGSTDLENTDGTVKNTEMLEWVTASGYLKNTLCTGSQVWVGLDTTGKALCGNKGNILANYGTISEQACAGKIYHADGTTNPATTTGTPLLAGDIVKTPSGCTMTIAFADTSILRLDGDTTVSLDVTTSAAPTNQTIASAILASGQMWGRILTQTGQYNLGSEDVIAWVRGTSVAVWRGGGTTTVDTYDTDTHLWKISTSTPTPQTDIAVIQSRFTTDAVTIARADGTKQSLPPRRKISSQSQIVETLDLASTYNTNLWIRENTKKDLEYLRAELDTTDDTNTLSRSIVYMEQSTSMPNTLEQDALCADNTTGTQQKKVYWMSLIGTSQEKCQDANLIAFADYTKGDKNLYFKDLPKAIPTPVSGVDNGGKYTLTEDQKKLMVSKTISFSFPNGKISTTSNQYLFYAQENGISYQRYLDTNGTEASPPTTLTKMYDGKFPNVSNFQLGFLTSANNTPVQILKSPIRIEFR